MATAEQVLPAWVQAELANPAAEGSRNDQLIKIGPTLLRHGHDVDSLFELFTQMHPDLPESEVMAVCRSSVKYAAREDATMMKGEFIELKKRLNAIAARARNDLPVILETYQWDLREIIRAGGLALVSARTQRLAFLETLFEPTDVVWIGEVWESGERERLGRLVNYGSRFRTLHEWVTRPWIPGEFCSHCTFKPGTISRCNEAVAQRKYMVVESDHLSFDQVGAVLNYLAETLNLRAIVSTGGKSIHGWFDWPPEANEATMDEWGATLTGYRCDPSTLRPSQPVRLPGITRQDTGRPQQLLWINSHVPTQEVRHT